MTGISSSFRGVGKADFTRNADGESNAAGQPVLTLANVRSIGEHGLPDDLPESSYDLLRRSAAAHGDRVAISYFDSVETHRQTQTLSYRELFQGATRAANMFRTLGIGTGDVVALLLPNVPETHLVLWGAEAAGIAMPLNPLLETNAIAALLVAAQAKLLVTVGYDPELIGKVIDAVAKAPTIENVVLISHADSVHDEQRRARFQSLSGRVGIHDFMKMFSASRADRLESGRKITPDDVASYFCTGGTTGLPKIAVRRHGQVVANVWMTRRMLGPALNKESVLFCGLPLFHVNAVIITGLVPFFVGASVLLGTPQGYRTRDLIPRFWEIVEQHRVTAFSAVPTLLVSLLEHPSAGYDLSSFRFAICGASPLSAEVLQRFEQTCRISISEGYGLTESCCVASLNPIDGEHRPGSVGLPLPAQEIRTMILDESGGYVRDAVADEIGVVAIAGPNIFSGYLDDKHNGRAWVDLGDRRKWLNTGDLGKLDKDGYLWLTGRAKDLIIRGGHNIDPAIIEEALYTHPDVALAAAVGRPDARVGELPVAYVQLRSGASVDETRLLAHVARNIGERAAMPKAITILDALPLTSVGKIHKPTLRHKESVLVTRDILEAANIGPTSIELREDGIGGGTIRIVASADDEHDIREALRSFTFPYQVEVLK
ncbi:MAG: acyl-CoA synthetase [Rhizomicrobium sp.]